MREITKELLVEINETPEDFVVLQKIPLMEPTVEPDSLGPKIALVQLETTGLDVIQDEVIKISVLLCDKNSLRVIHEFTDLQAPTIPMSEEAYALAGLTEEDLESDHPFDKESLYEILGDAEYIITPNSSFFRPFFHKTFPKCKPMKWGCFLETGKSLRTELEELGFWYDQKNTLEKVSALRFCLALQADSVYKSFLENIDKERYIAKAWALPFDLKDEIKKYGYKFNWDEKVWYKVIDEADIPEEEDFLIGFYDQAEDEAEIIEYENAWSRYSKDLYS